MHGAVNIHVIRGFEHTNSDETEDICTLSLRDSDVQGVWVVVVTRPRAKPCDLAGRRDRLDKALGRNFGWYVECNRN